MEKVGELLCSSNAEVDLTVGDSLTTEGCSQFKHVLLVQGEYISEALEYIVSDSSSLAYVGKSDPLEYQ